MISSDQSNSQAREYKSQFKLETYKSLWVIDKQMKNA